MKKHLQSGDSKVHYVSFTNTRNSKNRVRFEENPHTSEKYQDQEFCTMCTQHKHFAKDCFRNHNHRRDRNNLEKYARSVIKSGAKTKIRNDPINTFCTEHNTSLNFQLDLQEPIQPRPTESSAGDDEKSIEGMCLINEIPIKFTI